MVRIRNGLKTEKTTTKSVHLHENLRKSTSKATTKVRPNYDQEGQKKFFKSLFLFKGGPIQKIAYTGVNNL